jgi:hypothetical protein
MRTLVFILVAAGIAACSEPVPSRAESPEAAFVAARAGLRNHDLGTYFDALTDSGARGDLANSVTICMAGNNPAAVAAGLKASVGCEKILERYGWPAQGAKTPSEYKAAIAKIREPRALAKELEENHRRYGVGSSFVWEYLDNVKLSDVVIRGSRATGMARWDTDGKKPVEFEKDETGWRFDPKLHEK